MSAGAAIRAMPTLLKIGFSEAVAYRAEMIIWVLSTTMPLVMMVMWTTVAQTVPVVGQGGQQWGSGAFVTYFLSIFVVRQLLSAWAAWEINFEIRQGTLSMRLLRPIHPVLTFAMSNIAYMPLRTLVTAPVMVILLATQFETMSHDWRLWALWVPALIGGWLLTFFVNVAVGALAFFLDSSLRVMDVWLALFFVFSGYMFPIDLFPPWLKAISDWLPFRYTVGLPTELMTGKLSFDEALSLLARQWIWAGGMIVVALTLWNRGVRRFQSYGG